MNTITNPLGTNLFVQCLAIHGAANKQYTAGRGQMKASGKDTASRRYRAAVRFGPGQPSGWAMPNGKRRGMTPVLRREDPFRWLEAVGICQAAGDSCPE